MKKWTVEKLLTFRTALFTSSLLLAIGIHLSASAQGVTVTGRVTNEKGEPFAGVNIAVKNTSTGVVSGTDGNYSVHVAGTGAVLVFSHIGYAPQEIPAGNQRLINIAMIEQSGALTDVVVVAFAKQKAATVTGKDLVSISVSNVSNMLIGNAPGISGLQSSGEPGRNGANIFIRGVSTYAGGSSSQPLVVIDNVEQAPERAYDQL